MECKSLGKRFKVAKSSYYLQTFLFLQVVVMTPLTMVFHGASGHQHPHDLLGVVWDCHTTALWLLFVSMFL